MSNLKTSSLLLLLGLVLSGNLISRAETTFHTILPPEFTFVQPRRTPAPLFTPEEEAACPIAFDESLYDIQKMKSFTVTLECDVAFFYEKPLIEEIASTRELYHFKTKPCQQRVRNVIDEIKTLDDSLYKCLNAARYVDRPSQRYAELEKKKNAHIKTLFWSLRAFSAESEFLTLCLNTFNEANIDMEKTELDKLFYLSNVTTAFCARFDKLLDNFVDTFGRDRIDSVESLKNEVESFANLSQQLQKQISDLVKKKEVIIKLETNQIRNEIDDNNAKLKENWTGGQVALVIGGVVVSSVFLLFILVRRGTTAQLDPLAKDNSDTPPSSEPADSESTKPENEIEKTSEEEVSNAQIEQKEAN